MQPFMYVSPIRELVSASKQEIECSSLVQLLLVLTSMLLSNVHLCLTLYQPMTHICVVRLSAHDVTSINWDLGSEAGQGEVGAPPEGP